MSITSANALYLLTVTGLFPAPQKLQGFSADDVFDTPAISPAEGMMGVDGRLSTGFTFVPIVQNIALMADSESNNVFELWYETQRLQREILRCNATIILPSLNKAFVLANGYLSSYPTISDAKKVLQPRRYSITWESIDGAPT